MKRMIKVDLSRYRTDFLREWFSVTRQTVHNWQTSGEVPIFKYSKRLIELLTITEHEKYIKRKLRKS